MRLIALVLLGLSLTLAVPTAFAGDGCCKGKKECPTKSGDDCTTGSAKKHK